MVDTIEYISFAVDAAIFGVSCVGLFEVKRNEYAVIFATLLCLSIIAFAFDVYLALQS